MAARELFVWYRVRRERADEARAAVLALQQSLRSERPGLQARLLVRDDGETSTWMETYSLPAPAGDNAGIDQDQIEKTGKPYLDKNFSKLDVIKSATIISPAPTAAPAAKPKSTSTAPKSTSTTPKSSSTTSKPTPKPQ